MSSLKFGTSGLRGLTSELAGLPAYAYAKAFCAMMRQGDDASTCGELLVGHDLRASSPLIAAQCAQGIADSGFSPICCNALPTPALALAAMSKNVPAIMVTGSHIPDDRNGLKFYRATGEINKADEACIIEWHNTLATVVLPDVTVKPESFDALAAYRARYVGFFGANALKGLTIGVYQHSSVGRDVIVEVLDKLGAVPVVLGRSEHFIPVDTEALRPEDVELAQRWASERKFDAIVSTDGDADRPLVADETGRFLHGDLVGALTARFLGADAIVTPVTSNSALDRPGTFEKVIRTRVGSPYVIAGMAQAKAEGADIVIGFEANGGVLLGSDATRDEKHLQALPTRDALLPILSTIALARSSGKPLSAVAAGACFAVALSNRLQEVSQDQTAALIARLDDEDPRLRDTAFVRHGGVTARESRDGLRLTLGNGATVHFRASGNAPELRVYVEAPTLEAAEALLAENLAFAVAQTR